MEKSIADFIEDYFELRIDEPLTLQPYQRNYIENKAQFRLIVKGRQIGMSSTISWEALSHAILEPDQTILFISIAERQAVELLNYVKRVLDNARQKHHIGIVEESKTNIKLDNNSRIMSLPNSPNTIQGIRAQRIYIDEYALFKDDKRMLEAILPSISHGGVVTVLSRPMGRRGEFYRLVKEAREGKNNFVLFEIPYTDCTLPEYQKNVAEVRKILDEISFREQYCCEFIDETTSFFPYDLLLPCIDENIVESRPGMSLRFGIDFGRKVNSTVITEIELKDNIVYVRYTKEFQGVLYGTQLSYINDRITQFKPETVNVDEFGVGVRLFEELRNKHGSIITPIELIPTTKDKLIQDLRIMFEEKKIRIPRNDKLIQQLHALQRTVVGGYIKWEPGTTEDFGKHDDYVWSLAMAATRSAVSQIRYFKVGEVSPEAIGYNKEFRNSTFADTGEDE